MTKRANQRPDLEAPFINAVTGLPEYPVAALARAAVAEHERFSRDRALLEEELKLTTDSKLRRLLELRLDIEACDFLAITGRRIARRSETLAGQENTEEARKFRARAIEQEQIAQRLREQFDEHSRHRASHHRTRPDTTAHPGAAR
jgi:hypothetical protein